MREENAVIRALARPRVATIVTDVTVDDAYYLSLRTRIFFEELAYIQRTFGAEAARRIVAELARKYPLALD